MELRRALAFDRCRLSAGDREKIERDVEKIARLATKFPSPLLSATLTPSHRPHQHHQPCFRAALTLRLARRTLATAGDAVTSVGAFEQATRKMMRRIEGLKAQLSRQSSFGKVGAHKRGAIPGSDLLGREPRPTLFDHGGDGGPLRDEIARHLDDLAAAVDRCCPDDLRLTRLVPNVIDPEDILDDAVAEGLRRISASGRKPPRAELVAWFGPIIADVACRMADRFADVVEGLHVEDSGASPTGVTAAPGAWPAARPGMGHGYGGLEDLILEDDGTLQSLRIDHDWSGERQEDGQRPDPSITSVAPTDRQDFRREVSRILRHLPRSWRKTLTLRYFDGMSLHEIAMRQEVPLERVRWRHRAALCYLRHSVHDATGFGLPV